MINLSKTDNFIEFSSLEKKLEKLKEWKIISNKATEVKPIMYKGIFSKGETTCEIVGYITKNTNLHCINSVFETVVIELNGETHKINPAYLKQMQSKNFRLFSSEEE